jgi:hypothetical protein
MPQKASNEPTLRSMPAVRMTKVMPSAMRPVIDTWRATLKRLIWLRKFSLVQAKIAISPGGTGAGRTA